MINGNKILTLITFLVLSVAFSSCTSIERDKLIRQTKRSMENVDPVMGDWQGTITSNDGTKSPLVAKVIALGNGKYQADFYTEFDTRKAPMVVLDGKLEGAKAGFTGCSKQGKYNGTKWQGQIEDGRFSGSFHERKSGDFVIEKVFRFSPTIGAKPPASAVVLFEGNSFDGWRQAINAGPVKWKLINDAMEVEPGTDSIITEKEFADFKLHLEFRTPFMPEARGQARGNSGVYLQGRYEVQILDSYGLEGTDHECGGFYGIAQPKVNMCSPPMQWQSYDITFFAPRFDSTGKKIQNARMTVIHNGVKIHDNLDLPGPTPVPLYPKENQGQSGGIYLQNHGNPVQYRNIWLQKLQEG